MTYTYIDENNKVTTVESEPYHTHIVYVGTTPDANIYVNGRYFKGTDDEFTHTEYFPGDIVLFVKDPAYRSTRVDFYIPGDNTAYQLPIVKKFGNRPDALALRYYRYAEVIAHCKVDGYAYAPGMSTMYCWYKYYGSDNKFPNIIGQLNLRGFGVCGPTVAICHDVEEVRVLNAGVLTVVNDVETTVKFDALGEDGEGAFDYLFTRVDLLYEADEDAAKKARPLTFRHPYLVIDHINDDAPLTFNDGTIYTIPRNSVVESEFGHAFSADFPMEDGAEYKFDYLRAHESEGSYVKYTVYREWTDDIEFEDRPKSGLVRYAMTDYNIKPGTGISIVYDFSGIMDEEWLQEIKERASAITRPSPIDWYYGPNELEELPPDDLIDSGRGTVSFINYDIEGPYIIARGFVHNGETPAGSMLSGKSGITFNIEEHIHEIFDLMPYVIDPPSVLSSQSHSSVPCVYEEEGPQIVFTKGAPVFYTDHLKSGYYYVTNFSGPDSDLWFEILPKNFKLKHYDKDRYAVNFALYRLRSNKQFNNLINTSKGGR